MTAGIAVAHSVLDGRRLQTERVDRLIEEVVARLPAAIAADDREAAQGALELLTIAGDALAAGVYLPDGSQLAASGDASLLDGRRNSSVSGARLLRTRVVIGSSVDVGDLEVVVAEHRLAVTVADARFVLLALVSAVFAAGSLGALLGRFVALPFEQTTSLLSDAVKRRLGKALPEKGPKELRVLIGELNRMIAELSQRGDAVEGLVVQLREARDLAEASNAAKTRFLAHMSHELRTPLNAIMGYTKFVAEDLVGPEHEQSRDDLARVTRASEHLLSLIGQVLDLSKIEAGSLELDLYGLDVGAMVRQVVETSEPLARRNGNVLTLVECPKSEVIVSDALRLRQCLLNVIGNALKFTENGRVEVRSRLTKADGARVFTCEIRDTGPGIPEGKIAAIFEPFVQVDDGAHKQAGTGLGLAITKRLCAAMGGDITCSSVLGRGSTFVITIRDSADAEDARRAA